MCTGRIDLAFIIRAFSKGADGVFIGGCWPGECHYITEGNYDALANTHICKNLLTRIGVEPARLRLEWIAASEGSRFAEVTTGFVRHLEKLGPLTEGGGADAELKSQLAALLKLVPYLKLVERERLRVPVKSEAAYNAFYQSAEVSRLFDDLIADKLAQSRILALLQERPLSQREISERLSLNQSEVSRHMSSAARQGLVRYDVQHNGFAPAKLA